MFTGIIEEKGRIREKRNGLIIIEAEKIIKDLKIGDSIAVNGVCLTIVDLFSNSFSVGLMPETLRLTNLKYLVPGDGVNLERAMRLDGRLGGHLLSGHIDGLARLLEKREEEDAWLMQFEVPSTLSKYMVKKGSIGIDGISLTIAELSKTEFTVFIIPHTFKVTTLGEKQPGYLANIEVDMVAKFVERLMDRGREGGITQKFLEEHGFM